MKFLPPPSSDALSVLRYDPIGGGIYLTADRNRRTAGTRIDRLGPDGYLHAKIDGRRYKAHRIAWLLHHGEWPDLAIDHRNRIKTDNSAANLRVATYQQNSANMKGFGRHAKGTTMQGGRFRAQIQVDGRKIGLGLFSTEEEAAAAYRDYASKSFGEFARFDK